MRKFLFILIQLLWVVPSLMAQQRTLAGRVLKAADNTPVSGATIRVDGTSASTMSNEDGHFSLEAPAANVTLVVTSIGYETVSMPVAASQSGEITVRLHVSSDELDEVVVTALGIERKAKSLTYSTQVVKGEELTKVKDVNPINALTGKVSGLQINRSSSGMGGSVNIILRGFKSNRNNQPLYVVDGLPITNTGGSGPTGPFGGGTDRGDILSTLNPDDIASINVLKGASASALYGSQGANGAIMITTKKGAAGRMRIELNSGVTFDQAFYLPELQYRYGQTTADSEESWGEPGTFSDPVDGFFNTGTTYLNTVSLSGGTEKMQNYFSYGNTTNNGVLPTNTFKQHSLTFRNATNFFEDRLKFDGSLMYSKQDVHNRPASGLYFGPLSGLYMFPRGQDFDHYRENFEYFSDTRNLYLQNWWNINYDAGISGTHHQQNPYWILNRNATDQLRNNVIGQASLSFKFTDWLSLAARGTLNQRWDRFQRNVFAGTQGVLSGETIAGVLDDNGRYMREASESTDLYGDVLLNGDRQLSEDFGLTFTLGSSITDSRSSGWALDQRRLAIANIFLLSNIYRESPMNSMTERASRRQIQSVFGSANIGFREKVYVDLTARNDWSSTLANTPNMEKGYFYWSAGITGILSDMIDLPDFMTYSKVRLTYAEVGNDVAPFSTIPTNSLSTGTLTANVSGPYLGLPLRPEISRSFEVGYEGRFWNDRINLDIALYKTNTTDQYFSYAGPVGTTYTTVFLNAGNVENKGLEVALGADILKSENFTWNTGLNLTMNRNKILELAENLGETYAVGGNFNVMRLGGSFGDFWGKQFLRDANGTLIVDADGRPQGGTTDGYLGNNNPKALIGWNNTFSYNDWSLSLSVDGRFGGQVISITQGYLNSFGASEESAAARDRGGVDVPAVLADGTPFSGLLPAASYYGAIGNRDGIIEGQVYDATNIRLREVSLFYRLPIKWQGIQSASLGLTGRNLFFFRNDAPYDPELNTTTAVGGQGYDIFGLPTTRSYGLNLKVSF
ncbi:SusC/RagA family TonB-linked outer membrane protein [Parapedobacter sp. 10938]|uniref:SusC/RagA family TonB-linked outer membrane protein n=1 Tax=Parapedobacter flavus TaxID=3110225 RepID=UPI002DC00E12|nr:SusC/RagA family TonB-linked outer membrane protein [Parapedobacter sp. 10938]MEC3878413.1 SusC/RagA family TonB-linked outer membrane protein [Parapedobacter sp. 10938]